MSGDARKWVVTLCVLLLCLTPWQKASAVGGAPGGGIIYPKPIPNDPVCPDGEWPYYYYRHPVLFQEVTHVGTLQFVAFGYADACKQTGLGERGGTRSYLQELPLEFWAADALERMRALQPEAVKEDLPDHHYLGDNVYRWSLPEIPAKGFDYAPFFDPYLAGEYCPESPDGAVVCPGIHPDFARNVLAPAGWESQRYGDRIIWKIGGEDSVDAWFLSDVPTRGGENFWARHFAEDMKQNHSDGGFIRVILHPVDLELVQVPPETPLQEGATSIIPATIWNHSTRRALKTEIGWRIGDSGAWRPVDGWRLQGETVWRPPTEPIPLTAKAGADIEVRLSGVQHGQPVQLMANYTRTIPEADKWEGPQYSAYLNNIAETTIAGDPLDLAVTSLEVPTNLPCTVGGTYTTRWVIHNNTERPVTVRRKAFITTGKSGTWSLGERSVTLQPGDNPDSVTIHLVRCDDLYEVRVEVNPEPRAVEETNYANNVLARQTLVAPSNDTSSLPTFRTGTGKTIIVPSDCIPNPDATSDQPCLNHPHLRVSP